MRPACRAGHPYTPDNTYRRPDRGGRVCRACKRRYDRQRPYNQPIGGRRPGSLLRGEADPVAVDRAVAGDLNGVVLNVAERREAVRRLAAVGMPALAIARRVGCAPRTVERIRARLRAGAKPSD